jgi:signal transduction histidine kinase
LDGNAIREQIRHVIVMAENSIQTVRNIALLLRPSMLDDLGLIPALEWQAREISRRGEMNVEVRSEMVPEQMPDEVKICIYRIVQEALNNAAAHASAKKAEVSVVGSLDGLRVEITDDGRGFDAQRVRGMGLLGMEERVKHLGGSLMIVSRARQGTSVVAELPVAA